jgi:hypothetical protein
VQEVGDQDFPFVLWGCLRELDFTWVTVVDRSSRGVPFERRIPTGMPKVPANIKDSAFYLFPTVEDAKRGSNFGGTGFAVIVPSRMHAKYGRGFVYAVTNWHVAAQGSPVIRLNTKSGPPDIIDAGPEDWFFDGKHDIAVLPIRIEHDIHKTTTLHSRMLMSREDVKSLEIGPGDDVFMVGRFMDHDGGAKNQPAFRFGNISLDPTPIQQSNSVFVDAYCVDLHSRSGFSGSPVFVYRTPESDISETRETQRMPDVNFRHVATTSQRMFLLLGIHFAQFPELWEVTSTGKLRHESTPEPLLTGNRFIKGLSGMTCVLPAWSIVDVLNMPSLRARRSEMTRQRQEYYVQNGFPPEVENTRFTVLDTRILDDDGPAPAAESVAPPATGPNPKHREDFTRLLGAAAQKPAQED